jgi:hypothetical protein
MNRWKVLPALAVLWILLNAESCLERGPRDHQTDATLTAIDSIRKVAEKPGLSVEDLRALEESAVREVHDARDYVNVLRDTSLAMAFRQQAAGMIRALCISDSVIWSPGSPDQEQTTGVSIQEWIRNQLDSPDRYPWLVFDSVWMEEPLRRVNDTLYEGAAAMAEKRAEILYRLEIFAQRQDKAFGADTVKTWEVFLGSLKPLK